MPGIDGIKKKIDPVKEGYEPYDKNFLEDPKLKESIHFLPRNFQEALDALAKDNEYLRLGNIFTDDLLHQWVKIKNEEIMSIGTMPHPFEYKMYFTL